MNAAPSAEPPAAPSSPSPSAPRHRRLHRLALVAACLAGVVGIALNFQERYFGYNVARPTAGTTTTGVVANYVDGLETRMGLPLTCHCEWVERVPIHYSSSGFTPPTGGNVIAAGSEWYWLPLTVDLLCLLGWMAAVGAGTDFFCRRLLPRLSAWWTRRQRPPTPDVTIDGEPATADWDEAKQR